MFTGQENHIIPVNEAAALTEKFRNVLMPLLGGKKGEFFGRNALEQLLAQEGSVGIRVYLGLSNDVVPLPRLVLVAADANGNDILSASLVLEAGALCPPFCSVNNALNS